MQSVLREPLLHFLLIGAALFFVYEWSSTKEPSDADNQIVVSAGRIEQLINVFQKTWQRPPTAEELKGLIDDFVVEEIYYRKAVEMGIDRDDTIIRRRLRQKLEFLTEDVATLREPTDKELQAYLTANEAKFRDSPTYTFRQIYFNPEKHADPRGFVDQQLAALRNGDAVSGDTNLLPESFTTALRHQVDGTFGEGFAARLDELETGAWSGPIQSGLGLHVVKLDERTPGVLPKLSDIRVIVLREWNHEQRVAMRQQMNERMRDDFEVIIEWPDRDIESTDAVEK